jgi:hypothetical protein
MVSPCEYSVSLVLLRALSQAHGGSSVVEFRLWEQTGLSEPGGKYGVLFGPEICFSTVKPTKRTFHQNTFNTAVIMIKYFMCPCM